MDIELDQAQLDELKARAVDGDAEAQLDLSRMYENGEGVAQDYKEAAKWYRLAADQGNAQAQYGLGGAY